MNERMDGESIVILVFNKLVKRSYSSLSIRWNPKVERRIRTLVPVFSLTMTYDNRGIAY